MRYFSWSLLFTLVWGAAACTSSDGAKVPAGPDSASPLARPGYGPRVTPGIDPAVTLRDAPADWSTSSDGQLVEGLIFHKQPKIRHARVHFRNCKWVTTAGDDHWAFDPGVFDSPTTAGVIFERNDFVDALPALYSALPEQPARVLGSIFRGTSDGYGDSAKVGSHLVIEDSVFRYDYPTAPEAHADGLQSDIGDVENVTVRHSYFDVTTPGANAALLQSERAGRTGGWLIERNHIRASGAFPIRAYHLTGHGSVTVRDNQIDRVWIYGPMDITNSPELVHWSGNVDERGGTIGNPFL